MDESTGVLCDEDAVLLRGLLWFILQGEPEEEDEGVDGQDI